MRVCCSRCCAARDCVAAVSTSLFVAPRNSRLPIAASRRIPRRCSALGIPKSYKWVRGLDIMFYGRESISLGVARQACLGQASPAALFRAVEAPMQHSRRRLLLISSAALGGILLPFAKLWAQDPVAGS